MDFCVDCDGALNLFETNDDGLCPCCRRKRADTHPHPAFPDPDGLFLRCHGNTCQILSAEGWLLWSAGAEQGISLAEAVAKARRVQEIRRHRLKN